MSGVREIVVATDVEHPARAALRCSFSIADQFHASLRVVHATPPETGPERSTGLPRHALLDGTVLRRRLDALVREIPTGVPGCATIEIVEGPPAATVLAYAARRRSDLIVLGSSQHVSPVFITQHATGQLIARDARSPVLTVPHDARMPLQRLERIVLLVGEAPMERATQSAALFASRFRAVVELLHPAVDSGSDSPAALRRRGQEVAETLRLAGVAVEHRVGPAEADSARCVLARLEQGGCDLVVMSLERCVADESTIATVRRSSVVPVLSVCPEDSGGTFVRHRRSSHEGDAERSGAAA